MHLEGSCLEQGVGRRIECAARRQHIVDEPDAGPGLEPARGPECPAHVRSTLRTRQRRLRPGLPNAFEPIGPPGPLENPRDASRDRVGVVESAPPPTSRMEGDAHHQIGASPGFCEQPAAELEGQVIDREPNRKGRTEGAAS
jgi:hypothetical protein